MQKIATRTSSNGARFGNRVSRVIVICNGVCQMRGSLVSGIDLDLLDADDDVLVFWRRTAEHAIHARLGRPVREQNVPGGCASLRRLSMGSTGGIPR